MESSAKRPLPAAHDEAPSIVSDHPFAPKGEWFTLCGYYYPGTTNRCNLAESAHYETTRAPARDANPEE